MIELGKQYQTKDGCEARVYAVDAGSAHSVHGAIKRNGEWVVTTWSKEGHWGIGNSINDLVEVKPRIRREVWVNVYPSQVTDVIHRDKATADAVAQQNRIACVKLVIDVEEGEGL